MSIIKFINDQNRTSYELRAVLDYCSRKNTLKSDRIDRIGLLKSDVLRQMQIAKRLFHQEGGKQYQHLVISNDDNIGDIALVQKNAVQIAKYFYDFQIVAYTHEDTNNLHTHIVINTVNMSTGKKLILYKKDFNNFIKYANKIFKKNGLNPIYNGNVLQWNREDFQMDPAEYDTDYDYYEEEVVLENNEEYNVRTIRMQSYQIDQITGIRRPIYLMDEEDELFDILRHMKNVKNSMCGKEGYYVKRI